MSDRTAVETIQAAIGKLEALKAESTPGVWLWELPSGDRWPQSEESLVATRGVWKTCPYYCKVREPSLTSRGESGKPGHEHLEYEPVLTGWGYDASGITGFAADRDLIVTLHRTIGAQLAILRAEHEFADRYGWPSNPFEERLNVLALARSILGEES